MQAGRDPTTRPSRERRRRPVASKPSLSGRVPMGWPLAMVTAATVLVPSSAFELPDFSWDVVPRFVHCGPVRASAPCTTYPGPAAAASMPLPICCLSHEAALSCVAAAGLQAREHWQRQAAAAHGRDLPPHVNLSACHAGEVHAADAGPGEFARGGQDPGCCSQDTGVQHFDQGDFLPHGLAKLPSVRPL
eukprot:COSAG02_NODE_379_length_23528_cov_140.781510_1_plen_190_part_00